MKTFFKILLGTAIATSIIIGGLALLVYKSTASTLQGFQGGTGIATSTSANDNKCLTQSSSTPFLNWSISNCGTGTLSGNGTSSQVAYYTGSTTLSSSLDLVFNSLSGLLTVLGQVSSTNILAVHTTTTDLVIGSLTGILKATNGLVSQAVSGVDYAPATSGSSILKGNGSGGFSSAVNGTDFTLISSSTCAAGNHLNSISANGVSTCSVDTGSGGSATSSWLRNDALGTVYLATSTDKVGIGTSTPANTFVAITTATSTGGTKIIDGLYTVHIFNSSSTFTINGNVSADVLVVAGGGSGGTGGSATQGGSAGGGAGGLIHTSSTINSGSYSVVIGKGGNNSNGENSSFNALTSIGGGKGGSYNGGNGNDGGSSGGGAGAFPGGAGIPGIPVSGQGKQGGSGNSSAAEPGGGGGGGFTTSGVTSTDARSGNGGDGITLTISGSSVTYSCGGAGATWDVGGVNGTSTPNCGGNATTTGVGGNGTANTGGGGGGGNNSGGGQGGSGIVIIRYLTSSLTSNNLITLNTIGFGVGTTTPESTLHVNGNVTLSGVSSITTASIGGSLLAAGNCTSTTTSIDTTVTSSTASFVTTPQIDPGQGNWSYSFLSNPGILTTRVCVAIQQVPSSTPYIVKIIK